MKIQSDDENIQVSLIHSIYKKRKVKTVDEDGNPAYRESEKLLKQISVRKWIRKECIASVEEYVTTRNTISKNRSILFDRSSGRFYATFHNAEELWGCISKRNKEATDKLIGYKR